MGRKMAHRAPHKELRKNAIGRVSLSIAETAGHQAYSQPGELAQKLGINLGKLNYCLGTLI